MAKASPRDVQFETTPRERISTGTVVHTGAAMRFAPIEDAPSVNPGARRMMFLAFGAINLLFWVGVAVPIASALA